MKPEVYIVECIGAGFLAVMAKPVAGEYLHDDLTRVAALGVNRVVSLLEPAEQFELGLRSEDTACAAAGMTYASFPIQDRGIPGSRQAFLEFVRQLHESIANGTSTVVHCRAGIGRSGLVAAAVLVVAGNTSAEAFAKVSEARRVQVPDTEAQREFLDELEAALTGAV